MRSIDQETILLKIEFAADRSREEGHVRPCRIIWENTSIGQKAESEGKDGPEPLLWFSPEGMGSQCRQTAQV